MWLKSPLSKIILTSIPSQLTVVMGLEGRFRSRSGMYLYNTYIGDLQSAKAEVTGEAEPKRRWQSVGWVLNNWLWLGRFLWLCWSIEHL